MVDPPPFSKLLFLKWFLTESHSSVRWEPSSRYRHWRTPLSPQKEQSAQLHTGRLSLYHSFPKVIVFVLAQCYQCIIKVKINRYCHLRVGKQPLFRYSLDDVIPRFQCIRESLLLFIMDYYVINKQILLI